MLAAANHMLKDGTIYQDLGANHFDNRDKGKQAQRLVHRLHTLGFTVQITSMAA
jgi:transposase